MTHYIYTYADPIRSEIFYVGQGQGRRMFDHLKRKDHHPMTHRVQKMLREGTAPQIAILAKGLDSELANLVEQEAINKWGRKDLGTGPLLNLTDGGDGAYNPSPESRQRRSMKLKGRRSPMKGRKHSAETRALYSATRIGVPVGPRTDEARKRMADAKIGIKWAEHTCPHCGKTGSGNVMMRYHFDACKAK